jgi:hypothetical protein
MTPGSLDQLRRLEADFASRTKKPLGPQSPVIIGPKGVSFNLTIQISQPFRAILTQKLPNGEPALPDDALKLLIDECFAELKARGMKY